MCGCSSQWWKWKQILEWMKVTTAWFTASATILTSAINIKISTFKLNYLYNPGNLLFIHLLQVWSGRFTKDYDCSFILIGAATEAAQPRPVLQYQSMSASAWSLVVGSHVATPLEFLCNQSSAMKVSGWNSWLFIIWLHAGLQEHMEEVRTPFEAHSKLNEGKYI